MAHKNIYSLALYRSNLLILKFKECVLRKLWEGHAHHKGTSSIAYETSVQGQWSYEEGWGSQDTGMHLIPMELFQFMLLYFFFFFYFDVFWRKKRYVLKEPKGRDLFFWRFCFSFVLQNDASFGCIRDTCSVTLHGHNQRKFKAICFEILKNSTLSVLLSLSPSTDGDFSPVFSYLQKGLSWKISGAF